MLVVFGPALLTVIGTVLVMLFVPHPVPKTATGRQRLYLANCATCHGADGRGSWRATIFLMRPGDLGLEGTGLEVLDVDCHRSTLLLGGFDEQTGNFRPTELCGG